MFATDALVTPTELDSFSRVVDYVVGDFRRMEHQQAMARDPALWAYTMLGFELHDKQIEIAESVVANRNTAVAAGHGTGKSLLAALLSCWWVDTHRLGSAYVATTAPSADQISQIIFREIKRLHQISYDRHEIYKQLRDRGEDTTGYPDHPLPGRIGEDNAWKIEQNGKLVTVAKGRKPPDNKAEDAFQGLHAEYVLAIGDEATGLTEEMIDGLANITSNDTSRRLLISNPTNPRSYIGKIFMKPTGTWNLIYVSVFDLPTFHGGGRCDCEEHRNQPLGLGHSESALRSMSGPQFVSDKKKDYGEDSARYKARVLGLFAFEEGSNLFSDLDLASARDTVVEPDFDGTPVLGVDVARFGEDHTFVYRADRGVVMNVDTFESFKVKGPKLDENGQNVVGWKVRKVDSWKDAPLVDRTLPDGTIQIGTATRVHQIAMAIGAKEVRVDASGLGGGVIDPLYDMARDRYTIVEMLGGGGSPDRRSHLNNRAYQYDSLRNRMFSGRIDIDPEDELLLDELGGVLYDFADAASGGGMKIESKESMKRRKVKSPDAADAVWMACAIMDGLTDGPLAGMKPGDTFRTGLDEMAPEGRGAWFNSVW